MKNVTTQCSAFRRVWRGLKYLDAANKLAEKNLTGCFIIFFSFHLSIKHCTEATQTNLFFFCFFERDDERWIARDNVECKDREDGEISIDKTLQTCAKINLHAKKALLSVGRRNCKGVVYYELLPLNRTLNSDQALRAQARQIDARSIRDDRH